MKNTINWLARITNCFVVPAKRIAAATCVLVLGICGVTASFAQFADPALSTAAFFPIRTPIGTTSELRFTFSNSGSTAIPANSIELAVCPAFNYYTASAAPFGPFAGAFTWTPPGPLDDNCWRGVNNVSIAAFGGGQIRLTYAANALTVGPELTNINVQLIANFNAFENSTGNDNLQPKLEFTPLPNLTLSKSASVAAAPTGGTFTYAINVSNSGAGPSATNAVITDAVPAGVSITSLTNGAGWICTPTNVVGPGTMTCTKAAGVSAGATNELVATLNATKTGSSSVTNTATVTAGDPGCTVATPPARCTGSATVDPTQPSLPVVKTASVATIAPNGTNGTFSYPSVVSNSGAVASTVNNPASVPISVFASLPAPRAANEPETIPVTPWWLIALVLAGFAGRSLHLRQGAKR